MAAFARGSGGDPCDPCPIAILTPSFHEVASSFHPQSLLRVKRTIISQALKRDTSTGKWDENKSGVRFQVGNSMDVA